MNKKRIIATDDYYKIAVEILLEIGEISLCNKHPDETYFYQNYKYDKKEIYAISTSKLQIRYPAIIDFATFHSQIDQVLAVADTRNNCPKCNNDD